MRQRRTGPARKTTTAAALALMALSLAGCMKPRLPDAPLFRGVEALDSARGAQLLRARLARAFPIGRPETGLPDYLRAQGMKTRRVPDTGLPGLPIYGEADVTDTGWPCTKGATVQWRADAAGVLRDLSVNYGANACL